MMLFSRLTACRLLGVALLLGGLAGVPSAAQGQPKKDASPNGALRLPSGAIIVVAKDPDAIDRAEAVYLSPEKFKELNDQIEALRKQLAAEKALPPSACELDGRLETRGAQTIVKLNVVFKFRTTVPRSVVLLGCQKAQPVEARLEDGKDGKLPLLMAGDKGLSVLIEAKGEHTLRLDLELPLQPRGNEVGFEVGLPGAPITKLSFTTPAKVTHVTLSLRPVAIAPPPAPEPALDVKRVAAEWLKPGKDGHALGPISYLAVSWIDAGLANAPLAARSAEADVLVTIGETEIQTEARLRLKGSAKEWRFLAPSNAEVTVGRPPPLGSSAKMLDLPPDQVLEKIERPEQGKTEWSLHFREPTSIELQVAIAAHAPRNRGVDPKGKTPLWPVGPYAALDVPHQEGTIRVRSLPHIRAIGVPNPRGDTQRVDATDDPNAEAVYRYRSLPLAGKQQIQAPLDLEIRAVAGVVQTRAHHHLQIGDGGWRLRSDITVTPIRLDVESLELEVPASGVFDRSTSKLVEGFVPLPDSGPQRRMVQIKLAAPQRGEFALTLEVVYPIPLGSQEATLVLPRLHNVVDRAGQVTVAVPDGYDLRGGAYQWETDKPGKRLHPLEPVIGPDKTVTYAASVSRGLAQVELSWRPIHVDLRVETSADVTIGDGQAQAVQQVRCSFANQPQRRLRLRGSAAATGLAVTPGSVEVNGPGEWTVNLPAETTKEAVFTLSWSFPLTGTADDPARIAIPLLWLEGATSCETRVRFLRERQSAGRLLPVLETGAWQELPIELLPTEATLLVVRGSGLNLPLTILLRDPELGASAVPQTWIDRVLIQAQAADAVQRYRARFHVLKWQAGTLDVELPAAAAELELRIDGRRDEPREAPAEAEAGRLIRIKLPAWREREPLLIDLKYSLPGVTSEGWITRRQPPRLRGRTAVSAVRWQIALPAKSIPLSIGDGGFDERWTVRNGYAQPIPAFGTDVLDQWIVGGQAPEGSDSPAGWDMANAGLTARQVALTPLRLVVVPRNAWFVAISLSVLAVGLLLSRLPRRAVGVLLVLLGVAIVIVGFLWPQPASQVFMAAQPGLAILALFLALQRFVQWRYRRQLSRMPGFTRVHPGSALSRSNGKISGRQTSTVDSPAALGQ